MGAAAKHTFATAPIFCASDKTILTFPHSVLHSATLGYSGTTIKKAFRQCITHHRKAYFICHLPRERKAAVINRKD